MSTMCRSPRKRPTITWSNATAQQAHGEALSTAPLPFQASNSQRSTHARQDPDPRFRLAVHAVDRAAGTRDRRVLRDPSLRRRRGLHPSVRREGHHPVRRPVVGHRRRDTACAAERVHRWRSRSRRLLRHADHGGAARWCGRERTEARVRLRRDSRPRSFATAARHPGSHQRRRARPARRVDEPRRQGQRDSARLQGDRQQRLDADRRHGGRIARLLRHPVPRRGDAHAAGQGDPRSLRARDLRRGLRLEHARLRGRSGRAHPFRGRQGRSAAGVVGRRGFIGRCGADPSCHRRSAHLRVRRQRPAALERSRAGDGDLRAQSRA